MFVNTTENIESLITSAKIYFAKKSLVMFLREYMKGKDSSTNIKELDYLMSLIEVMELSLLLPHVNVNVIAGKIRRIIGPVVPSGANQVPPLEIITNEVIFAPDGIYGIGKAFYNKDVLTRAFFCPSGSSIRFNTIQGQTTEDSVQGQTVQDSILSNR